VTHKDPEKRRAYMAAWRAANPEKNRARSAAWDAANRDKRRASGVKHYAANLEKFRAYREAHREKQRQYNATYYATHADSAAEYRIKYNKEHQEKIRLYSVAYRKANREAILIKQAERRDTAPAREIIQSYRKVNKDKIRAVNAAYRQENPGMARAKQAGRRAMLLGQRCICCSKEEIRAVYDTAALCGREVEVDHTVALRLGGRHCTKNLEILSFEAHKEKTKLDVRLIAAARRRSQMLLRWRGPQDTRLINEAKIDHNVFDRFSADTRLWSLA
jgi:5-methylcytosine-specific restriction endonuclease McrA